MKAQISLTVAVALTAVLCGCGPGNIFSCPSQVTGSSCEEKSAEERAKDALEANDPTTAIAVLEEEISRRGPDDFSLHPLLAAAYARQAGIDLFNLIESVSTGGGGGSSSALSAFLPVYADHSPEEYDILLASLNAAVTILMGIPEEYSAAADSSYRGSIEFQKTLYASSYAVMTLNKFLVPDLNNPGEWDPERLQSMTPAEVNAIIGSLETAAAAADNPMSPQVNEMLEKIDSEDGSTTRDRLISYAQNQHQP